MRICCNYVPVFDMIMCLSKALDFINPYIRNHHLRVAYIALRISEELKLSDDEKVKIVFAAAMHDIGAFSYNHWCKIFEFDIDKTGNHAEIGYHLLNMSELFSDVAKIVRYHHSCWDNGNCRGHEGEEIPFYSFIIMLADRIDLLITEKEHILEQVNYISSSIELNSGKFFVPELVEIFKILSEKEAFWLEILKPSLSDVLSRKTEFLNMKLDLDGLLNLSHLFSQIIDFRSRFTSTHSSGVAATAEILAELSGFSREEVQMIKISGYLHDLGKLAVPTEILEKQGRLTREEFNIIKTHTYYTYYVLDGLPGFEEIKICASFHHERLDGKGYPFHCSAPDLTPASRIMAVADVFTAISEDRPYRRGMTKENVIRVLNQMAGNLILDTDIVKILINNFGEINYRRRDAQDKTRDKFEEFESNLSCMECGM